MRPALAARAARARRMGDSPKRAEDVPADERSDHANKYDDLEVGEHLSINERDVVADNVIIKSITRVRALAQQRRLCAN